MDKHYGIAMGQGLIGNLKMVSVTTGPFYSCSGIVFFNNQTLRGGLFHYPCNSLYVDHEVQNVLKIMFGAVSPDCIQIYPAGDKESCGLGLVSDKDFETPRDDIDALSAFFSSRQLKSKGRTNVNVKEPCRYVSLMAHDSELKVYDRMEGWPVDLSMKGQQRLNEHAILLGSNKDVGISFFEAPVW